MPTESREVKTKKASIPTLQSIPKGRYQSQSTASDFNAKMKTKVLTKFAKNVHKKKKALLIAD